MTIGELAKAAGLSPKTIRFYEEKKILPPARRSASGYRVYGPEDLRILQLVRRARSLGFTLAETKQLVGLAGHERCDSFRGRAAQLMLSKLAEVDEAIRRLSAVRRDLELTLGQAHEGGCQRTVVQCRCECLGSRA